jgi:ankyrin repeat protein
MKKNESKKIQASQAKLKSQAAYEAMIDAILKDDPKTVHELLHHGVDPNICLDQHHITPLHFAAQNNALHVVPLLISAGAHLNALTEPGGYRAIEVAALQGHLQMVSLLSAVDNESFQICH